MTKRSARRSVRTKRKSQVTGKRKRKSPVDTKDVGPPGAKSKDDALKMLDKVVSKPGSVEDLIGELRVITKKLRRTSSMVCSEEEFRRKVDHLKTMCPPPKRTKVKVCRVDSEEMTDDYGYVTKERDTFTVVIANNLTEYETEHVLLHEWAHVLCWRPYHPLQGDHGGDWGVWYATIWRKYHGVE